MIKTWTSESLLSFELIIFYSIITKRHSNANLQGEETDGYWYMSNQICYGNLLKSPHVEIAMIIISDEGHTSTHSGWPAIRAHSKFLLVPLLCPPFFYVIANAIFPFSVPVMKFFLFKAFSQSEQKKNTNTTYHLPIMALVMAGNPSYSGWLIDVESIVFFPVIHIISPFTFSLLNGSGVQLKWDTTTMLYIFFSTAISVYNVIEIVKCSIRQTLQHLKFHRLSFFLASQVLLNPWMILLLGQMYIKSWW